MRRELKDPGSARLCLALLWNPRCEIDLGREAVERIFGRVRERSSEFEFKYTTYYASEMGPELRKQFVEIEGWQARDSLVRLKKAAMALESRFLTLMADGRTSRQFNIDPMLVSLENVIVASSKNFPHRVYLGDGVFGDLALIRKKSGFEPLPWSYPDYVESLGFFEKVHQGLREGLRLK